MVMKSHIQAAKKVAQLASFPSRVGNVMKKSTSSNNHPLMKVSVNGHVVHVPKGATLLDAIKAAGVRVPTLCYHPQLPAKATCRMCLCEVEGQNGKLVPSCYTPAKEAMAIHTDTEELKAFQKRNLQFLLSRHPMNKCMTCDADGGNCKLQNLVTELNVVRDVNNTAGEKDMTSFWPPIKPTPRGSPQHPEHTLQDYSSPAIHRDLEKCIECGLCVQACAAQKVNVLGFAERGRAMIPAVWQDAPLGESDCISCGQCALKCPVGALTEKPDWHRVLDVLNTRRRVTVVSTAPATRVAIGEEFGFAPGTVSTGRLVNALRAVGFDYVMDTNFAADLTIMEEANELLARVRGEIPDAKLPLFTSCCPGWINWVEINRPDLIPHLSTTKSPQQMQAAATKYGPFATNTLADRASHSENDRDQEEPFVVSIMPCTAKKDEAVRPGLRGDVDAVLTTREIAKLIKHKGINFASLPNEGQYDSPLGESTGAAAIFGASGGVLEAALRTAADVLGIKDAPIDWKSVRGVQHQVKEATVPGVGTVAAVNSIGAAVDLLSDEKWKEKYLMIEVMTCKGGCLGGGGQPKSDDPSILEKRAEAIYDIDVCSTKRKSHENREVHQLYEELLDHPLSEKSEELLHATYAPRRSVRDKLRRFFDAVDHRDGMVAASLFTEDGEWHQGGHSPPLCVQGRDAIKDEIKSNLPPIPRIRPGEHRIRHRMADHAFGTDIITPSGKEVHCEVVLDQKTGLIKKLVS